MEDSDYETQTKVLAITPEIENELKKTQEEGWEVMPGTIPVAVYQLRRKKKQPDMTGMGVGRLLIDDSKILIISKEERERMEREKANGGS